MLLYCIVFYSVVCQQQQQQQQQYKQRQTKIQKIYNMHKTKQNPKTVHNQNNNNIFSGRIINNKQNNLCQLNHNYQKQYNHNTSITNKQYYGNNQHTLCTIEEGNSQISCCMDRKALITPIQKMGVYENCQDKQRVFNCHNRTKSDRKARQLCVNHSVKEAQFRLIIEDEILYYCVKCAVKLASQGFLVQKLYEANRPILHQFNRRNLQIKSNYHQTPNYHHLTQFLNYLSQVEHQHTTTMDKLSQIDNHYKQQIQHTQFFYQELLAFIQQMRDDHVNDLEQQQRRDSQIAMIQYDYLRENGEEIDAIWADIEGNLETIVEKMPQDDLRTNLKFYRYKVQVYGHKVEELGEFLGKVIGFKEQQYHSKLNQVQQFIMSVWNKEESQAVQLKHRQTKSEIITSDFAGKESRYSAPKRHSENLVIKPSELLKLQHQQTQKFKTQPAEKQKKTTAFRILFTEDEQTASASPQFKNL